MSKSKIVRFAVIGIILTTLVGSISQCTGTTEKSLYNLIDEIQRKFFPQSDLNQYIINTPRLLNQRVERDVTRAIENALPDYDRIIERENLVYRPRYSEKPVNSSLCYTDECKSLGGEMRICAPFYDGCN
jgi:hypothetical protein